MKKITQLSFVFVLALLLFGGCKKDKQQTSSHYLIFKFKLDSTQARLDNLGQPASVPSNHEAMTPDFKGISSHYVELLKDEYTVFGSGDVLYNLPYTQAGGSNAIDFAQETLANNGDVFFKIPLDSVAAGTYQYLRISLAYQSYTVPIYIDTTFTYGGYTGTINQSFPCTIASFIGFNTYINSYSIDDTTVSVNANKLQGYWGARTRGTANVQVSGVGTIQSPFTNLSTGQAPATTVVNPLASLGNTVPAGSCVVTGQFASNQPLVITGNETQDITVEVSLSINKSFEWIKVNDDGKWEPFKGENVVDMGIRGMIANVQ